MQKVKKSSLIALGLALVICFFWYKKNQNVAEELPTLANPKIEQPQQKQVNLEQTEQTELTDQSMVDKSNETQTEETSVSNFSIYKKGEAGIKLFKDFEKRTYLDLPIFEGFEFADFSEDEVAIISGTNGFGDRLTMVASRVILDSKDLVSTLSRDKDFLKSSDPDFDVSLMKPLMELNEMNGFSKVNIWKSNQNGRDYYMFYAPRVDGKGAYGFLLDGEPEKLDSNEDYYEEQLKSIRARKVD